MGDGGSGHCIIRMEWHPSRWSLLIFPCTIMSRSSLLAPAHPGGPVKWLWCGGCCGTLLIVQNNTNTTRRPASADRTARRQFQATGQPVSGTQASDAVTSWLPRYEAKCVQQRCFQCGLVPLHSDIKGTELPLANILIPLKRQLIALQLCR